MAPKRHHQKKHITGKRNWIIISVVILILLYLGIRSLRQNFASQPEVREQESICTAGPALCEAAEEDRRLVQCVKNEGDYRYFCAALITKNLSFCELSESNDTRLHCLAYNSRTPVLCENSTERDWCYSDLAMNWHDMALCEKVNSSGRNAYCRAVVSGNVSVCLELEDSNECIAQMADLKHDISLCNYANDKEECKKRIYQ